MPPLGCFETTSLKGNLNRRFLRTELKRAKEQDKEKEECNIMPQWLNVEFRLVSASNNGVRQRSGASESAMVGANELS